MIRSISKSKIPKEYCYALQTGPLNDLFVEHNIDMPVDLMYCFAREPDIVFYAQYWLPNNLIPYNRIYVEIEAVHKKDAQFAKVAVKSTILPAFDTWLKEIFALPENSPIFNTTPTFHAWIANGKIEIETH